MTKLILNEKYLRLWGYKYFWESQSYHMISCETEEYYYNDGDGSWCKAGQKIRDFRAEKKWPITFEQLKEANENNNRIF